MKLGRWKIFWSVWFTLWAGIATSVFWPNRSDDWRRDRIYDESADGAKQVSEALAIAKKEHKRVLLQFGANWCIWCHRLHKLFESDRDVKRNLKSAYVVVMIDVSGEHNAETVTKFGTPTQLGLPVIVIMDSDGKQLVTQDTGSFATEGRHDPDKVLVFLRQWMPIK